jgi:hypothetical protein
VIALPALRQVMGEPKGHLNATCVETTAEQLLVSVASR